MLLVDFWVRCLAGNQRFLEQAMPGRLGRAGISSEAFLRKRKTLAPCQLTGRSSHPLTRQCSSFPMQVSGASQSKLTAEAPLA